MHGTDDLIQKIHFSLLGNCKITNRFDKKYSIQWSPAAELAFIELKDSIVNAPTLVTFEAERETIIASDESKNTIGGVLAKNMTGFSIMFRMPLEHSLMQKKFRGLRKRVNRSYRHNSKVESISARNNVNYVRRSLTLEKNRNTEKVISEAGSLTLKIYCF